MDDLESNGELKFNVNGEEVVLTKDDLLIDMTQTEGYVSESDYGITVVLDTNLTPELLEEGFVREIISKIQTMRKEAAFEVTDKIHVTYTGSERAEAVFTDNCTEFQMMCLPSLWKRQSHQATSKSGRLTARLLPLEWQRETKHRICNMFRKGIVRCTVKDLRKKLLKRK